MIASAPRISDTTVSDSAIRPIGWSLRTFRTLINAAIVIPAKLTPMK